LTGIGLGGDAVWAKVEKSVQFDAADVNPDKNFSLHPKAATPTLERCRVQTLRAPAGRTSKTNSTKYKVMRLGSFVIAI
jgi:hypothetical protein